MRLEALGSPGLTAARASLLAALAELCATDPERAAVALDLGPTQAFHVDANALLHQAPTARADKIYTGVLYDALDLASVTGAARGRATRWLAIMSSLFGVLRPGDPIPAYRLSGDTNLPGIGIIGGYWREHLDAALAPAAGNGLVIDLRSSMYAGFWRPAPDVAERVATVRVLHEANGQRKVVSHFNKATKGRIVRQLLLDGSKPGTPTALAEHLAGLGWTVELHPATKTGQQLDVVVTEL